MPDCLDAVAGVGVANPPVVEKDMSVGPALLAMPSTMPGALSSTLNGALGPVGPHPSGSDNDRPLTIAQVPPRSLVLPDQWQRLKAAITAAQADRQLPGQLPTSGELEVAIQSPNGADSLDDRGRSCCVPWSPHGVLASHSARHNSRYHLHSRLGPAEHLHSDSHREPRLPSCPPSTSRPS